MLIQIEKPRRGGGKALVEKMFSAFRVRFGPKRKVLEDAVFVSEPGTSHFLQGISGTPRRKAGFPVQRLTDRELEFLEHIGRGKGTREIASVPEIGPRTVDTHRTPIREKVGLGDGNELVQFAARWVESLPVDWPPPHKLRCGSGPPERLAADATGSLTRCSSPLASRVRARGPGVFSSSPRAFPQLNHSTNYRWLP
jgi:DNA-binding CsgD family transcriptional regulator